VKSGVRADFIFDIRLMNTYGVILRGYTDFDYYQADSWRVEDGAVTLIKDGASVAIFPFENLLGIVDLTSGARLTEQQSRDTLASKRNLSGRTSPRPLP
jgi:hypothetical protein